MSSSPRTDDPRVFDLLAMMLADRERDELQTLDHYRARFPELQGEVEREHRRLVQRNDSSASVASCDGARETESIRALLAHLAESAARPSRYVDGDEIGRGGMGVVHRVYDGELKRSIARKTALRANERTLAAFLDEAQITGQLDHPGIVPVHELGLDARGQVFFTLRLVQGHTLADVFRLVEAREDGWTQARALDVLMRVCEAMAYAHSKGVIHRDLKPTNIMCGAFGEVYVMDWGLARVLETQRGTTSPPPAHLPSSARTTRAEELSITPDSPLASLEGDIVGTPYYMSPEQAAGDRVEMSARSDVYSVGAILYQILGGRAPYSDGEARHHAQILLRLTQGPPQSLAALNASLPGEFLAICEKAMARHPAARYADMAAMALDLRAFLDQRVVQAYRVGAWQEFKKWCRRNRTAAWLAATALVLLVSAIVALWLASESRRDALQAQINSQKANEIGLDQAEPAMRALYLGSISVDRARLRAFAADVALQSAEPVHPQRSGSVAERLAVTAATLLGEVLACAFALQTLRSNGDLSTSVVSRSFESTLGGEAGWKAEADAVECLEALAARTPSAWSACLARAHWRLDRARAQSDQLSAVSFPSPESRDDHDTYTRFTAEFCEFCDTDPRIGVIPLLESSAESPTPESAFDAAYSPRRHGAQRAIADRAEAPRHVGLVLAVQPGLVPIGRDPQTGLFEFAHEATGSVPSRGADGQLVLDEDTCIVLVLIPAQDLNARPVFVARHALTFGQWLRSGNLPSSEIAHRVRAASPDERRAMLMRPVEKITWVEAALALRRVGLRLANEREWDSAASLHEATSPDSTTPRAEWVADAFSGFEGDRSGAERSESSTDLRAIRGTFASVESDLRAAGPAYEPIHGVGVRAARSIDP